MGTRVSLLRLICSCGFTTQREKIDYEHRLCPRCGKRLKVGSGMGIKEGNRIAKALRELKEQESNGNGHC